MNRPNARQARAESLQQRHSAQMAMFAPAASAGRVIERSGGQVVNRPAANAVGDVMGVGDSLVPRTRGRGSLNPFQPHRVGPMPATLDYGSGGPDLHGFTISSTDAALNKKILATPGGVLIRTTNGGSLWRVLPDPTGQFLLASRHNSPGIPAFIGAGQLWIAGPARRNVPAITQGSTFWDQAAAAAAAAAQTAAGGLFNSTISDVVAAFSEGKIVSVDGVMYAQYGGGGSVGAPTRGRGSLNPFQPHRVGPMPATLDYGSGGPDLHGFTISSTDAALNKKILATPGGVLIRTTNGGSPWRVLPQTSDALAYPFLVASRHNSPGIPAFIIGGRLVVSSIKTKSNSSFWAQAAAASAAASAAAQGTSPCSIHDLTNCTVPAYDGTTPITANFVVEGKIVSVDGVMYAQYGGGGSVGAPNAVAASNTVGADDDCQSNDDCGPGMACAFGWCVGIPLPTIPPLFCGANSHPSPSNLRCDCVGGYGDDGNGNCVALKGAIQSTFEDICRSTGGVWDASRPSGSECACADPGAYYDSVQGCHGSNQCAGKDGGEDCTDESGGAGKCLAGNCVVGYCQDSLDNPGIEDDNGNCVAPQCPQGQGRGSFTGVCQDCGINGYDATGIYCNVCPPGSTYNDQGNGGQGSCDCAPGANWNADATACKKDAPPGQPPPPPPPPPPQVKPCDPNTEPLYSTAPGAEAVQVGCGKPPGTTPGGSSGGGYGLLLGLGAAGAALLLLMNSSKKGKSKDKRAHA